MTAAAPLRSARLLLGARILLVVAAAGGVLGAWVLARAREARSVGTRASYVCSMHPEVTAARPGSCPICRMALVPATARLPVAEGDLTTPTHLGLSRALAAPASVDGDGMVTAHLYPDDDATDDLSFVPAAGGAPLKVSPAGQDRRGSRRFRFHTGPPVAGTSGWIERGARKQDALVVPYGAVVWTPEGPFVLVVSADGSPVRRPVTLGRTFFGFVVVTAGLREGERVVGRGAVLYETERRLRQGPP